MENQELVTETVETPEPVAEVVEPTPAPAPVPEPEVVYSFQPTDDEGRPLGAPQVFKGKTQQEVLDKVANSNVHLIRKTRELTKKVRLGTAEPESIPDTAPRINDEELSFNPRDLTAEERVQISRDLLDPEKFNEASDRLFEAKMGAKPEKITSTINRLQDQMTASEIRMEARLFKETTPEYHACKENYETICSWMIKNNLAPVKENFTLAFNTLREVGLLLEAPIVREEKTPVNTQPEAVTADRIISPEPPQPQRPIRAASGLNRNNSSSVGAPSTSGKLTLADINKMSSEEYKKNLRNPAFARAVNELYSKPPQQ